MRILGIDPGTSLIGYGIIDYTAGKHRMLEYGTIRTPANIKNSERLTTVHSTLAELIKKWQPNKMAIEDLYFFKNATTVIKVSEMRGVLMLTASLHGLHIQEFTPLQVKQAVTGYGRADKPQVQKMVQLILGLDHIPKPDDAADGLALAICCANTVVY